MSDTPSAILTYTKYATACPRCFFLVMHLNIAFYKRAFSRSSSIYRVFRNVWSIRSVLIQALTCCVTEREAQGAEKGSAVRNGRAYCYGRAVNRVAPDKSAKLRVRSVFLHQRNEWHNEATPLNVREPSVSLPAGLCRMAEGGNT